MIDRNSISAVLTDDAAFDAVLRRVAAAPVETIDLAPLGPGEVVSHFEIVSELGRGGMGIVYLANDQSLKRKVALKVLPARLAKLPAQRERLVHEARSAAAVHHPNIATVYEVGEDLERVFIAIEYVAGQTLRQRLSQGALPVDELIPIARSILAGLAATHAAGLVHRDLKPENVMIARDGTLRILDFGLAKGSGVDEPGLLLGTAWSNGQIVGTPEYMSPEQALGEAVDKRTDIFSFGAMLYELITGQRPFHASTRSELVRALLSKEPAPISRLRPEISRALAAVVERCLAKVPAERFPDVAALVEALDAAAAPPRAGAARIALAGVFIVALASAWIWSARLPGQVALRAETHSERPAADGWVAGPCAQWSVGSPMTAGLDGLLTASPASR